MMVSHIILTGSSKQCLISKIFYSINELISGVSHPHFVRLRVRRFGRLAVGRVRRRRVQVPRLQQARRGLLQHQSEDRRTRRLGHFVPKAGRPGEDPTVGKPTSEKARGGDSKLPEASFHFAASEH